MLKRMLQNLVSKIHTCPVPVAKQEPIIQTIEALISDYDRGDLVNALGQIEHSTGWKVLRAALIKEYLNKSLETMDHSKKTGEQIEAAFTSGCAVALYDTATSLIERYKDLLANKTQAVEDVRPTED